MRNYGGKVLGTALGLLVAFIFLLLLNMFHVSDNEYSVDNITSKFNIGSIEKSKITYGKGDANNSDVVELLDSMSLERKVGQMFFCAKCNNHEEAMKAIKDYNVGGLLLYANYFEDSDKKSVKENTDNYQKESKIPTFIGVDEEGGDVVRFSGFSQYRKEAFLSPRDLYKKGIKAVENDTINKCKALTELGININFGPVCDISTKKSAYMYDRSLGQDSNKTSEYVKSVVSTMKNNGMGVVLKHFPGFGNNEKNESDSKMIVSTRSKKDYEENEFEVFRKGIDQGANCIMVSHIISKCFDENRPASISKNVHDYIRDKFNYNGVIITDGMDMEDIKEYTGNDTDSAVIKAVLAGNDMIISANKDYARHIKVVVDAVKKGDIDKELIDNAVRRVITWKKMVGLINN